MLNILIHMVIFVLINNGRFLLLFFCTLASYATQKKFISLDGSGSFYRTREIPPSFGEKGVVSPFFTRKGEANSPKGRKKGESYS
jgi:hypothetical protein